MSFLNSRKVSWIIFGITLLTAVVSLFFLPDIIPVHFGILGTPDGWDYKMGILLFPILQFFLLFLTGRKKVKDFMFRFARTPLNSIQYNWAVDGQRSPSKTKHKIFYFFPACQKQKEKLQNRK